MTLLSDFFFNFKDAIKELHEVPFCSCEQKTYSNTESGIISKSTFFSTSCSGAELALEKQRLGENCQIFKATGSQKFERNINT